MNELVEAVLAGQRRAVARAISLVEDGGAPAHELLAALHPHTGRAHILGITGPPGSGKSTLVNALTLHLRRGDDTPARSVGIIAVDPTSPFSGGAILGDRIRMRDLAGDAGIFIRSMASRGNLGGLAWATADAVKVLDAAGFDLVIVETVGAGQAEVDIARTAHTTVVVEVPGLGDDVQAIKAGILEIADVFAVNKADQEGADHAVMALRMMLDLDSGGGSSVLHHGKLLSVVQAGRAADGHGPEPPSPPRRAAAAGSRDAQSPRWRPPIKKTVASRGEGIAELAEAILAHRAYLEQSGRLAWRERERVAAELETIVQHEALRRALTASDPDHLRTLIDRVVARDLDPYSAARELLQAASNE